MSKWNSMKKIFPINDISSNKWFNYSNYLNWTFEKIQGWEDYLRYFSPDFRILNESMDVINLIPKPHKETIFESVIEPAWKYTITDIDSSTGETVSEEVYCYFPSELKFREGYLNTHAKSFLCYFAPPDCIYDIPFENIQTETGLQWNKTWTITKTEWNRLITLGKIDIFPPSRVILANKWRHSGTQHRSHTEAFNKQNYLVIAKPSAAWYIPTTNYGSFTFSMKKNAAELIGAVVPFIIETVPSRYILDSTKERWLRGFKNISFYAANWGSSENTPLNSFIYFISSDNTSKNIWTASYPLMHSLMLNPKNSTSYEDFIGDVSFTTETRNVDNHATAVYNINTGYTTNETDTDLWESIYISIC